MSLTDEIINIQSLRSRINQFYRIDESTMVRQLIEDASLSPSLNEAIQTKAMSLVETVRKARQSTSGIDSFLTEYALSSEEGIALMCLAEALLRVPDNATIDSLIKDKLAKGNWKAHKGQSNSYFVNATTWALMLTGKMLAPEKVDNLLSKALMKLVGRSSEPVIRAAVDRAMRIMSKQFVMGRTIKEAVQRAAQLEAKGYRYSYDMLGEAAITAEDADRYWLAYKAAIEAVGEAARADQSVYNRPGISVKLSALHPRYQEAQKEAVLAQLPEKVLSLAQMAKRYDIAMTIDAEESERLELSLDIIEKVFTHPSLADWQGFGLAVQSYQKRAPAVLDWLAALARSQKRRIMVRLIKGAYWDSEIKKTQMLGLKDYPVYTRKVFTDVSFQACAKKMLTMTDAIYPQFATHNAYSVAMILSLVGDYRDFEFQCLHGMGTELYQEIVPGHKANIPCRIYAPVGSHEDLLPYLVRRLLENGANSSFVNRIVDDKAPLTDLVADPVEKARHAVDKINQNIPLPRDVFEPVRKNSIGTDLSDRSQLDFLKGQYLNALDEVRLAQPMIPNRVKNDSREYICSPQNYQRRVGEVELSTKADVDQALNNASQSFSDWAQRTVDERADCIERFADLMEAQQSRLMALCCLEAGKSWTDAVAELREAIDFCRYYAQMARRLMAKPMTLQGYTGETNTLSLHPRGTVLCISPWNFPLAIFTGQVVAALVTGNCVVAKPAEQTPLIAALATELLHQAGVPPAVMQLVPGSGETIGAALVADRRVKAVMFTGSTETANRINQSLAARGGEIIPLIAETGGQNAMIVDSSALLEQVVIDVLNSAFGSAGQRCSALRVLYVQEEIYPRLIQLLKGAMSTLVIGDPASFSTDVGPVIDAQALKIIQDHVSNLRKQYEVIYQCPLPEDCESGYFMPPTAIAIPNINVLEREVFGPVLHVVSYKRIELDAVLDQINQTQYGLTFGIHSRINDTVEYIRKRVHVGNCYVNRNMIGAVVGLQPFGGEGLSGTGPKAGGPYYLLRLCHERTLTVDTTAAGGNATLMASVESV